MARLKSLFGNNSSQSNSGSKNVIGNKSRLASREQRFGKGIVAFDELVESLSVDGKRDDRDRDRLRSALEKLVRDGLIKPGGAKMLADQYMLNSNSKTFGKVPTGAATRTGPKIKR